MEARRRLLLEHKAVLEQQLGGAKQLRADLGRFSDVFGVLTPDKKRQALKLLVYRIVVNHSPGEVTKSDTGSDSAVPFRQKSSFLVNIELYFKPRFNNRLRKEAGVFVFHTEMAARAGIEPFELIHLQRLTPKSRPFKANCLKNSMLACGASDFWVGPPAMSKLSG
jgi:hypothetical protein